MATAQAPFQGAEARPGAMLTGRPTLQPIGHYRFCRAYPTECSLRTPPASAREMSASLRKLLIEVNLTVNHSIEPASDVELYGEREFWTYPDKAGDCEDYVLQKRRLLAERGMALSNLLITVVNKPDGEGHAVLTVRTAEADLVLDNLTDAILPWEQTGYRFVKRQATYDAGRWVSILDGDARLVGAID